MINIELIHFLLKNGLQDKKHRSRVADLAIIVEAIHNRIADEICLEEIEGKIYTDYSATQLRDRIPYLTPSVIGKRLSILESNKIVEYQTFYVGQLATGRQILTHYRRISSREVWDILTEKHNQRAK